jgi:hypothetical protein
MPKINPKSDKLTSTRLNQCPTRLFFQFKSDGEWRPLTSAANWATERLLLNCGHLVAIRALLNQIAGLLGCQRIDWNSPTLDQVANILPNGLPGNQSRRDVPMRAAARAFVRPRCVRKRSGLARPRGLGMR